MYVLYLALIIQKDLIDVLIHLIGFNQYLLPFQIIKRRIIGNCLSDAILLHFLINVFLAFNVPYSPSFCGILIDTIFANETCMNCFLNYPLPPLVIENLVLFLGEAQKLSKVQYIATEENLVKLGSICHSISK